VKYVLDTNVLLDFFIVRDKKRHDDCAKVIRKVKDGEIRGIILGVVVAETVWVMKSVYDIDRKLISKTIKPLMQMKGVEVIEKYDWSKVFGVYGETKVKFVDAMIANIKQVRERKWKVVSYDREFDKLGVIRVEPGDVVMG
jgi:predicted nucleic-acid-binding protein